MLILDKPRQFKSTNIKIPLYHRGHLSLFKGAKVWLCFLPDVEAGRFPELVLSPIHHDSWSDLWRITITLHERVGLVHDVFQILADNGINIVSAESSSRERLSLHSIQIIASARLYSTPFKDGTHEKRSNGDLDELTDLRRKILARLINDIAFLPSGQPWLKIRRVRNLLNARRAYDKILTQVQSGRRLKSIIRDTTVGNTDRGGVTITLPDQIKVALFESLGISNSENAKPEGSYLMVSNTTDRFLRIYFMKKSEKIIAPTIEHQDEIGALASITDALQNSDFNILTSLSRPYEWGTLAHTEFVLQPPKYLQNSDESEIRKNLERALTTDTLVERYAISVGYPDNYVTPVKTEKLLLSRNRKPAQPIRNRVASMNWSTEELLNSRSRELSQKINKAFVDSEDILRFNLVQSLVAEQATVKEKKEAGFRGFLFISYNFKEVELFRSVEKAAKKHHFKVITARELSGVKRNRDGIIKHIIRCTHFLGIWTEEGGYKVDEKFFPSPWLHWELGVSDALGKPWHLLISDKVHDASWMRIAAETPHSIYNTATFKEKLRIALRNLASSAQ
jgi:predicted amino acid-binding ACT domain protein